MNEYNLPSIRKFLIKHLNDQELRTLASDYFRDVYEDFSSGMPKSQMVEMLVEYCYRFGRIPDLMASLQRERERPFAEFFPNFALDTAARTPGQARNPKQIFISHAHQDAILAQRLAQDLVQVGWQVWMAPQSINPSEKWVEAIGRGLEASGVFLLLITPDAVSSSWVQSETNIAIELEHQRKIKFVPISVKRTKTPLFWQAYQHIPFNDQYNSSDLQLLLNELAKESRIENISDKWPDDLASKQTDSKQVPEISEIRDTRVSELSEPDLASGPDDSEEISSNTAFETEEISSLLAKTMNITTSIEVKDSKSAYIPGWLLEPVDLSELVEEGILYTKDAPVHKPELIDNREKTGKRQTFEHRNPPFSDGVNNEITGKNIQEGKPYPQSRSLINQLSSKSIIKTILIGGLLAFVIWGIWFKSSTKNAEWSDLRQDIKDIYIQTVADAYSLQPENTFHVTNTFQGWTTAFQDICNLSTRTADPAAQLRLEAIAYVNDLRLCSDAEPSEFDEIESGNQLPKDLAPEYRNKYIQTIADAYSLQAGNVSIVTRAFEAWPNAQIEICELWDKTNDLAQQERLEAIAIVVTGGQARCAIDSTQTSDDQPFLNTTSTPTPDEQETKLEERTHVVQDGENLFRIGLQYGYTVDELITYNKLDTDGNLDVGMVLRIPPQN